MNFLEKYGAETVLKWDGFYLIRKGQWIGICWGIYDHKMLMVKDLVTATGIHVADTREADEFMFKRSGEFLEQRRLYFETRTIRGSELDYGFPRFLNMAKKHLEEE